MHTLCGDTKFSRVKWKIIRRATDEMAKEALTGPMVCFVISKRIFKPDCYCMATKTRNEVFVSD